MNYNYPHSIGYIAPFYGNFGICLRAYAYILAHGKNGLIEVSENAVLNANYVLHSLKDYYNVPYMRTCMHECVFSAKNQMENGVHFYNGNIEDLINTLKKEKGKKKRKMVQFQSIDWSDSSINNRVYHYFRTRND